MSHESSQAGSPVPDPAPEPVEPPETADDALAGTVSWRELLAETTSHLAAAGVASAPTESRWIVEEASGMDGTELVLGLDEPARSRAVAHLDAMVARRVAGEPVQYVLGHWAFRTLDLLCDSRVLIPRPETEQVVDVALAELDRVVAGRSTGHRPVAVDLGTGSGAIALSLCTERPHAHVWGVERSVDALAVARANLAGLGMAAARVRLVEGSWFDPLPTELRGTVDLVITNPPYIAAHEVLPPEVEDWEPIDALVPGLTGLEAYKAVLAEVGAWLAPGGVVVAEIGSGQAVAVAALARSAGLVDVRVETDHAGLDRAVVARQP